MERFDPGIQQCSFGLLCGASGIALMSFLTVLLIVG